MSQNNSTPRYIHNMYRDPLTPRCTLITAEKGEQTPTLFAIMKFEEFVIYARDHASKFPPALKIQLVNCIFSGSVCLQFSRSLETLEITNVFDTPTDEERAYVDISCCEILKKLILTANKIVILNTNLIASLLHLEVNQYSGNLLCFKDPHLLRNLTTFVVTFGCLFSEFGTFFTPPDQNLSSQDQVMDVTPLIHLELLGIREAWSYYNLKLKIYQRTEGIFVTQLYWELKPTKTFTFDLSSIKSWDIDLPLD